MKDRLTELEHRLARAERRLAAERRAHLFLGVLTVSIVTLLAARPAATQSPGGTVKAPFRVVNDQGKTLLEMIEVNQHACLRLYDSAGTIPVVIATDDNGGFFGLSDESKKGRFLATPASLSLFEAGKLVGSITNTTDGGKLLVGDKSGTAMAGIWSEEYGGHLSLCNRDGKPSVALRTEKDTGVISVMGPSGHPSALLSGDQNSGSLILFNQAGKTTTVADGTEEGGRLLVYGRAGTADAVIGAEEDGGQVLTRL